MDEILKKLLESDLLSEDTKVQLSEQFNQAVTEYLAEERSKLEVEVRTTLTEEFVKARDQLAESVEAKIDEFLNAEFSELHEDINKYRDQEVVYAEKLVEEKERLAEEFQTQLDELTDKLDAFLEVRIDEEFDELKSDIEDVKKLEFGRKIFEAVESEFKKIRKEDLSSVETELAEAQDRLYDAERRLAEIEETRLSEARNGKLEQLLSPLSGNAKEQMKIILSNVSTEKLDETFKVYIGRVLRESVNTKEDKTVISESKETKTSKETSFITGNEELEGKTNLSESKNDESLARMRALAGIK